MTALAEAHERAVIAADVNARFCSDAPLIITAYLASLEAAGFVLMPVEPIREQWAAAGDAIVGKFKSTRHHDDVIRAVHTAMISARPRREG